MSAESRTREAARRLAGWLGLDTDPVLAPERRRTVAVPLADDVEVLGCVGRSIGRTAEYLLIGDEECIREAAREAGVAVDGATFLPAADEAEACAVAAGLARDGKAHLLMKGRVQTSTFTRSILDKTNGLLTPGRLLSHVTLASVPGYERPLILTDAAINIDPTVEQKVEILRNALEVTCALGIARPRVACIAPVEKVSAKIPSTVHAAELERMARENGEVLFGPVDVQGPLGLDLAVSPEAARIKGVGGPVAGRADVLLLPGMDAANVLYKTLTKFAGAVMACVLAGCRIPVVLTSRADSEETRYLSLGLALKLRA